MKVPLTLSHAFGEEFVKLIAQFAVDQKMIDSPEELVSPRFLSRSIVPHIKKLSSLFNREEKEQSDALDPYWKESSNTKNFRLAYFLYFMPSNLYRVAAVWSELGRLGYRWKAGDKLKGIEFGAGPASGICGILAGETHTKIDLPTQGNFALIEQDKGMLRLGAEWAQVFMQSLNFNEFSLREFHRKIDLPRGFLPPTAPKFNLWIMSYFLNEFSESPEEMAKKLLEAWKNHLENEGLIILVEPALKLQSRRLLAIRKALIAQIEDHPEHDLKILLPCLGHQACGALAAAEDWCHEDVSWWRPSYFKRIDQMAGLDRKTLPFSYLVLAKSSRTRDELLPALKDAKTLHRLVSPAHSEGQDLEFYLCGQDGKRRARIQPKSQKNMGAELERGDILENAEYRGDTNASRITHVKGIK